MNREEAKSTFKNIVSVALLIVEKIKTDKQLRDLPPFEFASAMAIILTKVGLNIGLNENDLKGMISASVSFSKDETLDDLSNVFPIRR